MRVSEVIFSLLTSINCDDSLEVEECHFEIVAQLLCCRSVLPNQMHSTWAPEVRKAFRELLLSWLILDQAAADLDDPLPYPAWFLVGTHSNQLGRPLVHYLNRSERILRESALARLKVKPKLRLM